VRGRGGRVARAEARVRVGPRVGAESGWVCVCAEGGGGFRNRKLGRLLNNPLNA